MKMIKKVNIKIHSLNSVQIYKKLFIGLLENSLIGRIEIPIIYSFTGPLFFFLFHNN
jgi:hypothetical protein